MMLKNADIEDGKWPKLLIGYCDETGGEYYTLIKSKKHLFEVSLDWIDANLQGYWSMYGIQDFPTLGIAVAKCFNVSLNAAQELIAGDSPYVKELIQQQKYVTEYVNTLNRAETISENNDGEGAYTVLCEMHELKSNHFYEPEDELRHNDTFKLVDFHENN